MDTIDILMEEQEQSAVPYSPDASIEQAINNSRFTRSFPDYQVTEVDIAYEMELTRNRVTPARRRDDN